MKLLPAALAVLFNSSGEKILLIKRNDIPIWVIPGGGIEENESPSEAVSREVYEETGLEISIERLAAELSPANSLSSPTFIFIGRENGGVLRLSNESVEAQFFSLKELPKELFFLHREWIQEVIESKTLIKRSLREVNYRNLLLYVLKNPIFFLKYLFTRLFK